MLDQRQDDLPIGTICIEDLEIGMQRALARTIEVRHIELFAELSGDMNPVHLDHAYALDTVFGGRIAHGMLTAALISAVIGEQLPGHGTVYLGQTLKFRAPVVRPEVAVVVEAPHPAPSRDRRAPSAVVSRTAGSAPAPAPRPRARPYRPRGRRNQA